MNRVTLALLASVAVLGAATSSYAADLIVDTPTVVPGIVETAGNWDGPYVGVFGGYAWGEADHTNSGFDPPDFDGADADLTGWMLGVKAGVNFTLSDSVVAGVVGDLAWSNISGTFEPVPVIDSSTNTINWQGSVRGLIGFDAGAFLPYLTAGLAFANATHEIGDAGGNIASVDATHVGWTVGAGVSFAVADNASLNLEYRYSDFGSAEYDHDTGFTPPEFDLTSHAVTVGLNWSF